MHATATNSGGGRINETAKVEDWIREQLTKAGFSDDDITAVIGAGLDWRTLVRLRECGCPRQLALAIVG